MRLASLTWSVSDGKRVAPAWGGGGGPAGGGGGFLKIRVLGPGGGGGGLGGGGGAEVVAALFRKEGLGIDPVIIGQADEPFHWAALIFPGAGRWSERCEHGEREHGSGVAQKAAAGGRNCNHGIIG
jgi:hypothetical protein